MWEVLCSERKRKPVIICKYGRQCYTSECVFSHPRGREVDEPKASRPCIYGEKCKTSECPFMHAKGERKTECKFGIDCSRTDCVFSHPIEHKIKREQKEKKPTLIICRYGAECHLSVCHFSHPKKEKEEISTLIVTPDLQSPKYWTSTSGNSCIDVTREMVRDVQKIFDSTCRPEYIGRGRDSRGLSHHGLHVLKIERVENDLLWKPYSAKKHFIKLNSVAISDLWAKKESTNINTGVLTNSVQSLTDSLCHSNELDKGINELYLFHGTKQKYVEAIKTTGFDERVSANGLFGLGIYFAENSSKSDEYVVPGDDNVYCYMFICRVCLGTPYLTGKPQKDLRRPPCLLDDSLPSCAHPRFDSLIGLKSSDSQKSFLQKYREFIVYDRQQCYPEFLVTYRRETRREWEDRVNRQQEDDEKEERRKKEQEEQCRKWEQETQKRKEEEEKQKKEEEEKQRKLEQNKKIEAERVKEELRRLIADQTSKERTSQLNANASTFSPNKPALCSSLSSLSSSLQTISLNSEAPSFVPKYSLPPKVPLFVPNPIVCKFGSICSRPDCTFSHPECRYGSACTRVGCKFSHPGK